MSARRAAMEPGAAGSAGDPRRRRRHRHRGPAPSGQERGRQRRGARTGYGGAAGPRWYPDLRSAPPRFEVCRLNRKVALSLGLRATSSLSARPARCRPPRGPGPANLRSPACRGHVSRRRPERPGGLHRPLRLPRQRGLGVRPRPRQHRSPWASRAWSCALWRW
jgi:hypothetical protein